jgi:cytochrome c oxidase subunit 3
MTARARENVHRPGARISNEAFGMALFIVAEVMFFAAFVSTYVVSRTSAGRWKPDDVESLVTPLSVGNSLVLAASGISMLLALLAIRRDDPGGLKLYLAITCVLGLAFAGIQAFEIRRLLGIVPIGGSAFGNCFYVLGGVHFLHVLGGVVFLAIVLLNAARGKYHRYRAMGVLLASFYWWFVVIVWGFLFVALYVL